MNSFLKKPKVIITTIILILIVITISFTRGKETQSTEELIIAKEVQTKTLSNDEYDSQSIDVVGSVNAETSVDVIAMTRGTVKNIFFNIGDSVIINQTLISMYDNSTLTSLNNAQTNLINTQSSKDATVRILEESVRQAELGIQSAKESIDAAEIGLKTANNNLENAKTLKIKSNEDSKKSAVIAFGGHLDTIFSVLDQVDSLFQFDEKNLNETNSNIPSNIGAQDPQTLVNTKANYAKLYNNYKALLTLSVDSENITKAMNEIVNALNTAKKLLDSTISVLNKTVTNSNFSETTLTTYKTTFSTLRTNVVGSQTSAKNTLHALENLELVYTSDIEALENAVQAAQNQVDSANIGYENSLIALENAKKNFDQQNISTQSAVDNARGQVNLAQIQAGNLSIKAPIAGKITKKLVELGAEVSAGQKIAEIQQAEMIKIKITLSSEDIYRIEKGQNVQIGDEFTGIISSIDPSADPVTKKVGVEIMVDNTEGRLIPGTFIDVSIPVKGLEKSTDNSIFIPLRSIIITQTDKYVYVVDKKIETDIETITASKRIIETGKTEGAMIEIIKGLNNDDELIIEGAKNLDEGDEIKVIN